MVLENVTHFDEDSPFPIRDQNTSECQDSYIHAQRDIMTINIDIHGDYTVIMSNFNRHIINKRRRSFECYLTNPLNVIISTLLHLHATLSLLCCIFINIATQYVEPANVLCL